MIFVWCKNLDRSFFRFVTIHAYDRRTHRQTDSFLIAKPRLHCMQRGKNLLFVGYIFGIFNERPE